MTFGPLDLIPRWALLAVIVVSQGALVHYALKASRAEAETAKLTAQAQADRAAALAAVRAVEQRNTELLANYNRITQEADHALTLQRLAAADRARTDAATLDRLRRQLAAYTSGGGQRTDPATPVTIGDDHRLSTLGGLLAESLELLVEGRSIVERRDAEVKRLIEQVAADRAASRKKEMVETLSSYGETPATPK